MKAVTLVIPRLLILSPFGVVHAETGRSYIQVDMLAINATVLPGSGNAIAVVQAKKYEGVSVFNEFNFPELKKYNLTKVISDVFYIF